MRMGEIEETRGVRIEVRIGGNRGSSSSDMGRREV